MIRYITPIMLLIFATVLVGEAKADAQSFDGITIIDFSGPEAIASGNYIVTFVSARGSYGAVVSDIKGHYGGCQSLAVPGSYTGSSITFGVVADERARKHRLKTYCPTFSLRFENATTVRVEAGGGSYSRRRKIIAHIPLRAIDFESAHFARHDLKGVRLGPALNGEEVGPLNAGGVSDKYKWFKRTVGMRGRYPYAVMGRVAGAKITGWPWDVLYYATLGEEFAKKSTFESFKKVVYKKYGEPSSTYGKSSYFSGLWMFDMDGRQITLDEPMSNSCRATAEFALKYTSQKEAHAFVFEPNINDLGPWGCSIVMDLRFNSLNGGVEGYSGMILSGYVKAMNHFFQRIEQVTKLLEKVRKVQGYKPKL
jgi:hypothetical protein